MPGPFETKFIAVKGLKTAYWEKGDGFPLILIHGLGSNKFTWRHCLGPLSQKFRVIAPDLRGTGESEKRLTDHRLYANVLFFRDFMDALGIPRAHLVGNSVGGGVVASMGSDFPERVGKIILMAPAVYAMRLPFWFRVFTLPGLRHIFPLFNSRFPTRMNLSHAMHRRERLGPEVIEGYHRSFDTLAGRYALMRFCYELKHHPGLQDKLPRVHQETLLLWGDHDRVVSLTFADRLLKDLAHARLQVLKDSGHAPQEDQPEILCREILKFLLT